MPTTMKQKSKAIKSREADMLSKIENLDIMLGSNHLERAESELSYSVRRPESPSYNALVNHNVNSHFNSREDEIRGYAGNGPNSSEIDSSKEIIRLSGELNQMITQEMNDLMSSVSSQIQRAISEAINEQNLLQALLRSGKDMYLVENGNYPGRRPEWRSEEALNRKFRSSSRDELPRDFNRNEDLENTHYSTIGIKLFTSVNVEEPAPKTRLPLSATFCVFSRRFMK